MQLIDTKCPNCGAMMQVDDDKKNMTCPYCGSLMLVDDGVQRVQYENAEEAGYAFEKGRQRALNEASSPQVVHVNVQAVSPKNKAMALVLCVFVGYFGIHRFYVGKSVSGLVYLFTMGVFGLGWLVDIFLIATGSFTDANGRYLK